MADGGVLATDPGNDAIFWSGGKYYYMSTCVSTDGGLVWTRHDVSPTEGWTYALAVDPTNSDVVFAGGIPCIYKSTNSGLTWTPCSTGVTGYANALSIDPADNNHIFAGTTDGVFISNDGGNSWRHTGCTNVNTLLFNPSSPDTMLAGTDTGVWQSPDQGETWSLQGLEDEYVRELYINPDRYYYAGTYGSGVFRWEITIGIAEQKPITNVAIGCSAYPNPMHTRTMISFNLPDPGLVRLILYDIQGRHVATLTDCLYTQGSHAVRWKGLDDQNRIVAPGVYFYTLLTEQNCITGKIIRLK